MNHRAELLDEAKGLVLNDRNNCYGEPDQDFKRTAVMWNALGLSVRGEPVEGYHVAMMMAALKLSRLAWSPAKMDSWADLAGYAACGWETYQLALPAFD